MNVSGMKYNFYEKENEFRMRKYVILVSKFTNLRNLKRFKNNVICIFKSYFSFSEKKIYKHLFQHFSHLETFISI